MGNFLDKRDKSIAPTFGGAGGAMDKASKFRWAKESQKPELRWIRKELLNLDDNYQREARSNAAVMRIARDWDWMLFEALGVVEREDGTFWVYSGGHRLRASFYRRDIPELPCAVFKVNNLTDEARAFVAGAMMRCSISSFDSFRASVVASEPDAIATNEVLDRLGLRAKKTCSGPNDIKCIHTIRKCVSEDVVTAESVLALLKSLSGEDHVDGRVYAGLFRLVRHFNGRNFLGENADKLSQISQREMQIAVRQMIAETGKGGEFTAAKAILGLVNKGKKKKIAW